MTNPLPELKPGDHLLYAPSTLVGCIIAVKTWGWISHIEVYAGSGVSFGSRGDCSQNTEGRLVKGVDAYPLRIAQLAYILRPRDPFNFEDARAWFYSKAKGQDYDLKGLFCFTLAVKQGSQDKMFCSEFATRFDRECGIRSFSPNWDADKVAPDNFLMSGAFDWIWSSKGLKDGVVQ